MAVLRKVKVYGYFGDCPDKNLCQNVAISLYQENDAQIDIHIVDFSLNPMTMIPTVEGFSFTLYNRNTGNVAFQKVLTDSTVSVSDGVISVRLHDTELADLAGSYRVECHILIDEYYFTLFMGTVTIKETNIALS